MEIELPHKLDYRDYQKWVVSFLRKWGKRAVNVWHRRAWKDKTYFNLLVEMAIREQWWYAYILPTYAQWKKIIWDSIDKNGLRFKDHIPKELLVWENGTELKFTLANWSFIQILWSENIDSLRGISPRWIVFSEYAFQNPTAWEVMRPILAENWWWAIFNSTPNGKNHFYDMCNMAKDNPEWYYQKLSIQDTWVVSNEYIEEERKNWMSEEMIQQEYYCFPEWTDITTIEWIKDISEIREDDIVLTHSNRFRKVKNTIQREYEWELVRITSYWSNKDILCTPNHPIRITDWTNYIWKKAEDITTDDRICFPKLILWNLKKVSENFVKIICWYIAEWSVNKQNIQWTLNANEINFRDEILLALKEEFGIDAKWKINENTMQIQASNSELRDTLIYLCWSNAKNKKIPYHLITWWEWLVYKILMDWDWCYFRNWIDDKDVYTTISKTLAYQFQMLANSIGKKSCIKEDLCEWESILLWRKVHINNRYTVTCYQWKYREKWKMASHKYSVSWMVRSVKKENFKWIVYNFWVQYDESYIANWRMVHNCSFDVGAIGSYYSKQIEEAKNDGRITKLPVNPDTPIDLYFDLWVNDNFTISFKQNDWLFYNFINYYENNGKTLEHYFNVIDDFIWRKGKLWLIYLPHDSSQKAHSFLVSWTTILDKFKERYPGKIEYIPNKVSVNDWIQEARKIFPKCRFDNENCSQLIRCLENYKKDWDDTKKVFRDHPLHDWSSHWADNFRYFAISDKKQYVEDMDYVRVWNYNSLF